MTNMKTNKYFFVCTYRTADILFLLKVDSFLPLTDISSVNLYILLTLVYIPLIIVRLIVNDLT